MLLFQDFFLFLKLKWGCGGAEKRTRSGCFLTIAPKTKRRIVNSLACALLLSCSNGAERGFGKEKQCVYAGVPSVVLQGGIIPISTV